MNLTGLRDILPFLKWLNERHIWKEIHHFSDDSLTVNIYLPGLRLEVDFFDDHVEYSTFNGTEEVLDDQDALFALLEDR